jgi:hypothetical protein
MSRKWFVFLCLGTLFMLLLTAVACSSSEEPLPTAVPTIPAIAAATSTPTLNPTFTPEPTADVTEIAPTATPFATVTPDTHLHRPAGHCAGRAGGFWHGPQPADR